MRFIWVLSSHILYVFVIAVNFNLLFNCTQPWQKEGISQILSTHRLYDSRQSGGLGLASHWGSDYIVSHTDQNLFSARKYTCGNRMQYSLFLVHLK